ncbi:MAG: BrnT family toxin [Pseudomonadota bacterium]
MRITYDPQKRAITLAERGLDFEDTPRVFAGPTLEAPGNRRDYGEVRWQTVGWLNDRLVMVIWTERDDARRIISMRYIHAEDQDRYLVSLDRPG